MTEPTKPDILNCPLPWCGAAAARDYVQDGRICCTNPECPLHSFAGVDIWEWNMNRQPKPQSGGEVVTVEELANRLVIEGRSPDSAEVMLDHVHIGYWKARLERLAKMFPNGIRIIKPESE